MNFVQMLGAGVVLAGGLLVHAFLDKHHSYYSETQKWEI